MCAYRGSSAFWGSAHMKATNFHLTRHLTHHKAFFVSAQLIQDACLDDCDRGALRCTRNAAD